jgi:hypothetical protein
VSKAVVPSAMPGTPEGATGWARSRRTGSMYHAHALGRAICGARVNLDRNESEAPRSIGDLQYWGVCPRCFKHVESVA